MKPLYKLPSDAGWNDTLKHKMRIVINAENDLQVKGVNLEEDWSIAISNAIIIGDTQVNHQLARASARLHGLTVTSIESHNLTSKLDLKFRDSVVIKNIVIPLSHADRYQTGWHHQVRSMNHRLEYHEISRIFDHMAAWHQIITDIRRPTIILESNAVLDHALPYHVPMNSIIGLDTGGKLYEHSPNYRVMPGVWAYSIDHFAARKMFNRVMDQGIRDPLELMFRADQQLIELLSCAHRV